MMGLKAFTSFKGNLTSKENGRKKMKYLRSTVKREREKEMGRSSYLVQKVTNAIGVPSLINVPESPWNFTAAFDSRFGQEIATGLFDSFRSLCKTKTKRKKK